MTKYKIYRQHFDSEQPRVVFGSMTWVEADADRLVRELNVMARFKGDRVFYFLLLAPIHIEVKVKSTPKRLH